MSGRSDSVTASLVASKFNGEQSSIDEIVKKVVDACYPPRNEEWQTAEEWLERKNKRILAWVKFIKGDSWDEYGPDDFDKPHIFIKIASELVKNGLASQVDIAVTCDYTDGYNTTSIDERTYIAGRNEAGLLVRYVQKPVTKIVLVEVDENCKELDD